MSLCSLALVLTSSSVGVSLHGKEFASVLVDPILEMLISSSRKANRKTQELYPLVKITKKNKQKTWMRTHSPYGVPVCREVMVHFR